MTDHATRTRRQFLRTLAGVTSSVTIGASAWRGGLLTAESRLSAIDQAASATDVAVRIDLLPPSTVPPGTGEITMPVANLDGGLVCLNNFNGSSVTLGPCGHRGVDIGENGPFTIARPLVACVDGVIERDEVAVAGGNMRILRGDDGRWYRYHHLSAYEDRVEPDDRVVRGQTIGYMGKTGNTQWTHLHFEVWEDSLIPRDGTAVDPVPLMDFPSDVQLDESRSCEMG